MKADREELDLRQREKITLSLPSASFLFNNCFTLSLSFSLSLSLSLSLLLSLSLYLSLSLSLALSHPPLSISGTSFNLFLWCRIQTCDTKKFCFFRQETFFKYVWKYFSWSIYNLFCIDGDHHLAIGYNRLYNLVFELKLNDPRLTNYFCFIRYLSNLDCAFELWCTYLCHNHYQQKWIKGIVLEDNTECKMKIFDYVNCKKCILINS